MWGRKAGAEERHPAAPALSPFCAASHPFLRRPGQGGDPGGGRKGSTWLGREGKRRVGSRAGRRDKKGDWSLGSCRASRQDPPPNPCCSTLLGSREAATAPLAAFSAAPAAASCAALRSGRASAARRPPTTARPSTAPPETPPLAREQARRQG